MKNHDFFTPSALCQCVSKHYNCKRLDTFPKDCYDRKTGQFCRDLMVVRFPQQLPDIARPFLVESGTKLTSEDNERQEQKSVQRYEPFLSNKREWMSDDYADHDPSGTSL